MPSSLQTRRSLSVAKSVDAADFAPERLLLT
jgi:hypothetical protein